jgi:hypothetical protein
MTASLTDVGSSDQRTLEQVFGYSRAALTDQPGPSPN